MKRRFMDAMRAEETGARRKSWAAIVVTWIAAAAICLLISINW
jgi:hypothetical protein